MELPIIDLFELTPNNLSNAICIGGISTEVNKLIWHLGGPAKASKIISCNYATLKEWHLGRAPIPLMQLKLLLEIANPVFAITIKESISNREFYLRVQRSNHNTVKFPKEITPELAYVVGLLLGDGSLAGNSQNKRGNWCVTVFFDNWNHLKIYQNYIKQIFGINAKIYKPKNKNYHYCYFASKAVHWYLRNYFNLFNGYKADKIIMPQRIIEVKNSMITSDFIAGLFDSDGTIIQNKAIKFASTSEKIVDQLTYLLCNFNISSKKYRWLKDEKYKTLYTVAIADNTSMLKFAESINLKHPEKRKRLYNLSNSIINR